VAVKCPPGLPATAITSVMYSVEKGERKLPSLKRVGWKWGEKKLSSFNNKGRKVEEVLLLL